MSNDNAVTGEKTDSNLPDDLRGAKEFAERTGQHHPIAEFLYQLTKMLTDDNNEIVEWADGRIKVHFPERLEAEVLHKYFRHSKFASFQRQLNYFGFRKIAGKGKMSPCSYVNEAATSDIRSLLLIKRKTNGSAARKAAQQRNAAAAGQELQANTGLTGISFPAIAPSTAQPGQLTMLNGQLTNAMALLTENALRAGLGQLQIPQAPASARGAVVTPQLNLFALQQQQQLQQLAQQQLVQQIGQQVQAAPQPAPVQAPTDQIAAVPNLLQQSLQAATPAPVPVAAAAPTTVMATAQTPSLEQLQAQLTASLARKQPPNNASLLGSGLALRRNPASSALNVGLGQIPVAPTNPASAALKLLNAQTAAPASDNAATAPQTTNNPFESAINLRTLLSEHSAAQEVARNSSQAAGASSMPQVPSSAALLHRLPSSGTIFPELSAASSFGNLLGSSHRLNSLLSLNSFLGSREPSLADIAAANTMSNQLATGATGGLTHRTEGSTVRRENK